MTLFFADLVREFSSSTGAGDFVLGGAVPGHRRFAGVVPAGARFHYAIAGVTHPQEWETGEGEIGSGGTLLRAPVASSAGGGLVAFSAGLKTVALTVGASWFAAADAPTGIGDVTGLQAALDGKAAAGHGHGFGSLTDKPTTLAGYGITDAAAAGHGHSFGSLSGKPTTLAGYGITDAAAAGHHHDTAYQPLDADLSAIASIATTNFGRAQLGLADAAALRTHAGLGSAAVRDVGTSGAAVPVLNGGATAWSAGATFSGALDATTVDGRIVAASGAPDTTGLTGPSARLLVSGGSAILQGFDHSTLVEIPLAMNASSLSFRAGNVVVGQFSATGLNLPVASLRAAGTQVVGVRRTGWTAPTGTAARTAFDTETAGVAEVARRLKALIDDLSAHGLIGA